LQGTNMSWSSSWCKGPWDDTSPGTPGPRQFAVSWALRSRKVKNCSDDVSMD
jgi:hypothetical protein